MINDFHLRYMAITIQWKTVSANQFLAIDRVVHSAAVGKTVLEVFILLGTKDRSLHTNVYHIWLQTWEKIRAGETWVIHSLYLNRIDFQVIFIIYILICIPDELIAILVLVADIRSAQAQAPVKKTPLRGNHFLTVKWKMFIYLTMNIQMIYFLVYANPAHHMNRSLVELKRFPSWLEMICKRTK